MIEHCLEPHRRVTLSRAERELVRRLAFQWPTTVRDARAMLEAELLESKARGEPLADWLVGLKRRATLNV